jgi:hypothetical protein
MRFLKRLFRILVLVVLLGGIGVGIMYHLSTRTPTGYTPSRLTDEQRYEMSRRVDTQKIPQLLNLAEDARNHALAANKVKQGEKVPSYATRPVPPLTLSFTQDEINATLWKWSGPYKSDFERYVTDPFVALEDGQIILMGTVPEFGGVASAYFEPKLDENGLLHCDIAKLRLGSLPLPEAVLSKKRQKIEDAIKSRLPEWEQGAKIDATGVANSNAKAAALGKMVLQMLNHEPSPAVIFVTRDAKSTVPVRLTNLSIEKGEISITVQPIDPGERAALLEQIRTPQTTAKP